MNGADDGPTAREALAGGAAATSQSQVLLVDAVSLTSRPPASTAAAAPEPASEVSALLLRLGGLA